MTKNLTQNEIPTWFRLACQVADAADVSRLALEGTLREARTPEQAMELMLDTAEPLVNRPDTLSEALGGGLLRTPDLTEAYQFFKAMEDHPENHRSQRAATVFGRTSEFFNLLSRPNGPHYGFLSREAKCAYAQDVRWAFSMGATLGLAKHARREMDIILNHPDSPAVSHWTASSRAERIITAAANRFGQINELGGKTPRSVLGVKCHGRVEKLLAKLREQHQDLQAAFVEPKVPFYVQTAVA